MWPKKKDYAELHQYLQNSFQNVRQDHQAFSQWIQHLHRQSQQQQQHLNQLHQTIQHHEIHLQHHQLRLQNQPPESQYQYLQIQQRIEQLNQKVELLLDHHHRHSQQLDHHHQKLDEFHQKIEDLQNGRNESIKPRQSFKEKIVQTFSRNSKNYLKNLIFQYLEQHEKISALQLKDIIVDQQGLASKSTFYRLLEEIENSPQVTVIWDGRQKYFLLKNILRQ